LAVQALLGDGEAAHAIGLQEERELELVGGQRGEEEAAIGNGPFVQRAAGGADEILIFPAGYVGRAFVGGMLHQVREGRMSGSIAPRSGAVGHRQGESRRCVVGRECDVQAVSECKFLERKHHRIRRAAEPPNSGRGHQDQGAEAGPQEFARCGFGGLRPFRRGHSGESLERLFHRLKSLAGVLLKTLHDGRVDAARQRRRQFRRVGRTFADLFQRQRNGGVAVKGGFTGEHLVEGQAVSVDIDAMVEGLAFSLFRRHVSGRSHHAPGHGGIVGVRSRDAEVHHLEVAIGRDHDVLRLEVAMHDGLAVRFAEAVRQLPREFDRAPAIQAALALQETAQAFSLHEFHREVDRVAGAMEFV